MLRDAVRCQFLWTTFSYSLTYGKVFFLVLPTRCVPTFWPSRDQHSRPYITYCCGKMKDTVERPKSLASEVLQRATKAAGHIRKMTLGKDQEVPFHIIRLKHVEDWRLFWTAISVTLLKLYIAYIIHIYTSVSVRLCFPRFLFLSSSFLYTFWHIW